MQALQMNATRGEKQRALENTLHNFCPDAVEASELLLALIAGLEERYDTGQVADVLVETKRVLDALDELERTTCSPGNMTKTDVREWIADQDIGQELEEGVWK
jgi:hypothetical protein